MAIHNFTDEEAIEICISVREKVIKQNKNINVKDIYEYWREPDALAQVINLAQKQADFERKKK